MEATAKMVAAAWKFCGSNNTVKMGEEEEGYYIVFHPRDYEEDAFAA